MKKIILLVLVVILSCSMFSCSEDNTNYVDNVFFDVETLMTYSFEGLPMPNIENSKLNADSRNELYLNLSDEEFAKYVEDVANYILARENIYNIGTYYEYYMPMALFFIPLRADIYIPLEDNMNFSDSNKFAFSHKEELHENVGHNHYLAPAYEIEINRVKGRIEKENFDYNTYIQISETDTGDSFDGCAKEHKLVKTDEKYKVPNSDIFIYKSGCAYCDIIVEDNKFYTDNKEYELEISEGEGYIAKPYRFNRYSGDTNKICLWKNDNIESFKVIINGEEYLPVSDQNGILTYHFAMPKEKVVIQIIPVEKEQ